MSRACPPLPARRTALASLLGAGALLAGANAKPAAAAAPRASITPKFNPDGSAAHYPGNSIICHVDRRSENFMALLDIHCALMRSGMLHRIAPLPPASYHMTVFNGVSYPARRQAFPADLPADADDTFCNEWLLAKLKRFDLATELPLRMRALPLNRQSNPYNIQFAPVDAAEDRKLRRLRDRLAETLHYRLPDHETFRFHVTLHYFYATPTADEQARFFALHRTLVADFLQRAPVLELHNPEYVYFDDMYQFRPQLLLRNQAGQES
ncbi:DUF1868 domain-containing protein [Duganella sp. Leaf126]|uniref:DUF1868 domain-containing protein n=1 Tax=Duganella sp. Leaf126 TaxID=1736266 RepID=UPI0006FCCE7A|nr:DUF1868 domain-containing protein [Duganella sp. Leaf126]